MTNKKMEQRLASALEKTAPDDVCGVLSRCEVRKGTAINMTTKKQTKKIWPTLVAACLAVILLGGGGLFYQQANAVASVVSLDVNPSIALTVNRQEKVLSAQPMNDDAAVVLEGMELNIEDIFIRLIDRDKEKAKKGAKKGGNKQ